MAVVRYNATRRLMSGISLNQQVTLDLRLASLERAHGVNRTVVVSLALKREIIYDSEQDTWSATSVPLTGDAAEALKMFLHSVQAGEAFEFAPYDRAGDSPIDYRDATIGTDGYKETRVSGKRGGGGADDYFSYSFGIVETP